MFRNQLRPLNGKGYFSTLCYHFKSHFNEGLLRVFCIRPQNGVVDSYKKPQCNQILYPWIRTAL